MSMGSVERRKHSAKCSGALLGLLRHPAGIIPIIGNMDPEHLTENCTADGIALTRDEWYALLDAAADIRAQRRRRGPD
jgi:predicted oxidoreductase